MNSNIVKYALIAGAAYLIYEWYVSSVNAAAGSPVAQPPATPPPTTEQPGGNVDTSQPAQQAQPITPVLPSTDPNVRAATDAAYAAQNYPGPLYSAYAWNWYRSQGLQPIYDAQVLTDTPDTPITAAEYHQRMQAAAAAGAQPYMETAPLSGLRGGLPSTYHFTRMPADYRWLM